MSFSGDLEHLSIVDVIQLMHTTRKSGTLCIKGRKGESQLVFDEGYIVSANHVDNSIRIGKILVEARVVAEEALQSTLAEQAASGDNRKPLIAALMESGRVSQKDAYRGLETLIELTIVEILTWKSGTFALDVSRTAISDEYRYFPEKLNEQILLHTENILMDALRLYDEKKRDGLLPEDEDEDDELLRLESQETQSDNTLITVDDLGLGDLELMDKKIPDVFKAIEDRVESPHIATVKQLAPAMPDETVKEVALFLDRIASKKAAAEQTSYSLATIILFSRDELLTHYLSTICKPEGIYIFSATDQADLLPLAGQFLSKAGQLMILFDAPSSASGIDWQAIIKLRDEISVVYPHLCMLQLADDHTPPAMVLSRALVPAIARPARDDLAAGFSPSCKEFLENITSAFHRAIAERSAAAFARCRDDLDRINRQSDIQSIAFALLTRVSESFARSLTLIVKGGELIAERGFGIRPEDAGEPKPLWHRFSLERSSLITRMIQTGKPFFGNPIKDQLLADLYNEIGAPKEKMVYLLPLQVYGTTLSLTYADFGQDLPVHPSIGYLDFLARQAGLVAENIQFKKKVVTAAS